jgi:hypothetical protein
MLPIFFYIPSANDCSGVPALCRGTAAMHCQKSYGSKGCHYWTLIPLIPISLKKRPQPRPLGT